MPLLYHAYVYLEFLILACTIYILASLLGYDYNTGNTYKHGNSNLFWRLDKDSIADQSAIFLIIRATGICWNQVVCKRLAGNKGILLKIRL